MKKFLISNFLISLFVFSLFSLCPLWLNANMEMGMDYLKKGVSLWNEEFLLKAEKEFQKEENYYYLSLVQYRLATFYLVSEKNEQAKRYAEKGIENVKFAIEKNNNSAASYTILGNLYGVITGLSDSPLLQAKYGYLCLKNVKQAVEMEPKNSFALSSLGITYFNTPEEYGGGIDKAVEMLDKAIASDRGNVEAYIWLSRCYIKKGEIDKAKGFLRKALDVEPQNRWAKNILRNLEKRSTKSISGKVIDVETGEGLSWVNIIVEGTTKGGISGNNGNFLIKEIEKGQYRLRFTRIGYADVIENLIVDSKTEPIFIGMESVPVMIQGITITASPVKEKREVGQTIITPVELWRLPGSGAELFWGLKSLPGVSGGDIAPIVVRGGNSRENIVLLDGIRLEHPYHLESIGGGIISFFEPSILSNVTFTSGGFGVKDGNGLSSVVDVRTRSPRSSLRGRCSISLANGYIGVEGRGFSNMNYLLLLRGGTTYLISNMSGSRDEFEIFPQYYDLFSKVIYQYNQSSKLEILGIGNSDVMKPRIDDSHTYLSKSNQKIISIRNRTLYKNGILRARVSFVDFVEKEKIEGYYRNDSRDRKLDCEVDFEKKMGPHRLETGGGIEGIFEDMNGEFPDDSLRFLNPQSEIIDFSNNTRRTKMFYFIQDEFRIRKRITLVPGLRIEHISQNRETVLDPRFSLAYLLGRNTTLKLSTGIYHQSPQSTQDLMAFNLPSEKAVHYVLGIEKGMKRGRVRLEGFYKTYENLPLKKGDEYVSDGFGYARGVDCLVQLSRGVLSGFFVYSFTDSERREMDADRLVTSSYEIPHSFTISVTGDLLPYFSFGVKYRCHTGRVYTPVFCGRYDEAKESWVPVFGEMSSARFPSYRRVDIQVSKVVSIKNNGFVLFAECENILGNENVVRYYYSQDFSEKEPLIIMKRTVVAGFMFYF